MMPRLGQVLVAVAVSGCSFGPNPYLPPANATPLEVLTAYLEAYKGGRCSWARQLWIDPVPNTGDGDLCGDAQLLSFSVSPEPARPTVDIANFATSLTTSGSRDGSVEPGRMTWFFQLNRQADGSWRIEGGGSGP
jgi:hypothetical protein